MFRRIFHQLLEPMIVEKLCTELREGTECNVATRRIGIAPAPTPTRHESDKVATGPRLVYDIQLEA